MKKARKLSCNHRCSFFADDWKERADSDCACMNQFIVLHSENIITNL